MRHVGSLLLGGLGAVLSVAILRLTSARSANKDEKWGELARIEHPQLLSVFVVILYNLFENTY